MESKVSKVFGHIFAHAPRTYCLQEHSISLLLPNFVNAYLIKGNKKLSWCWQQARRVYRSVEVNKHGTIPHVTYSFLLCNSNFVFKTRRFTIFVFKKFHDLEIGVKGHW